MRSGNPYPVGDQLDERQWQGLERSLERAEPLPDRTYGPTLIRRATLTTQGALTPQELSQSVRTRGSRVAFVKRMDLIGYEPGMVVPTDGLAPEMVELLRERLFHYHWEHEGELLLAVPQLYEAEEIAALLCVMVRRAPDHLRRIWGLAVSLGLLPLFLDTLSPTNCNALVELLLEELLADTDDLSFAADLELQTDFADRAAVDTRPDPADRSLATMFEVEWSMQFLDRDRLGHHCNLAATIVLAGSASQVGHCLSSLPLGQTHQGALRTLVYCRPVLLADLVAHPSWRRVGVYGLTQLPMQSDRGHTVAVELFDEWRQVQVLARRALVGPSASADDICDLLLHDEADTPPLHGQIHVSVDERWRDALTSVIADAPLLDVVASRLEQDLRADGPPRTNTYAAAMRLARALRAETSDNAPKIASRLALGWAEAYLHHARDPDHPRVPQVEGLGTQLEGLNRLPQDEPATWRALIKPLNPRDLHRQADRDTSRTISGAKFNPQFDGPRLIENHTANLVAIAQALVAQDPRAAHDLLDASLEMMTRVHGWPWSVPPFSLSAPWTPKGAPRYSALGTTLATMGPDDAEPIMRQIVRRVRHPVLVGQFLWGLGKGEQRTRMAEHFADVLDETEDNLTLGEAKSLTKLALSCERYEDAQRCAAAVIRICDANPKFALGPWKIEAEEQLDEAQRKVPPPATLELVPSGTRRDEALTREGPEPTFPLESTIDLAIMTVIREEFFAVQSKLDVRHFWSADGQEEPNRFAWRLGAVRREGKRPLQVVLALIGRQGNIAAHAATVETIRRWRPRGVLLVGVAGGLGEEIRIGDVVVARSIADYESGKIERTFQPRGEPHRCDGSILASIQTLAAEHWRPYVDHAPPDDQHVPQLHEPGVMLSGEKLIHDRTHELVATALGTHPRALGIEMEGYGAAEAAQEARIPFAMIRGISDLVRSRPDEEVGRDQRRERDNWKVYASNAAAGVAIGLLRHQWPLQ
jgi:nucleoside phosphorylase